MVSVLFHLAPIVLHYPMIQCDYGEYLTSFPTLSSKLAILLKPINYSGNPPYSPISSTNKVVISIGSKITGEALVARTRKDGCYEDEKVKTKS